MSFIAAAQLNAIDRQTKFGAALLQETNSGSARADILHGD
jgi:hypothetical protein